MNETASNSRLVSRILLFDQANRLLLMQASHPLGHHHWVAPGGGLDLGETFEAAAQRELYEETGQALPIGPCVWTRRHAYEWNGRKLDQTERFFIARTNSEQISPTKFDGYVIGHRWWSFAEIEGSTETLAPRRLAQLLRPLLDGELPNPPIDCGV